MTDMRLVFSHGQPHVYEDRATHVVYLVGQDTYREVPDDVAAVLLRGHPDKLCDVTDETEPELHRCRLTSAYHVEAMSGPPVDEMARPALPNMQERRLGVMKRRAAAAKLHPVKAGV